MQTEEKARLIEMGQIVTLDADGRKFDYKLALLIEFDSVEAIRKAIADGYCHFSFGDEETQEVRDA